MKKQLRISATQLETWRKFRALEYYTEERLCKDLFGEYQQTVQTEIGTAFHAVMEDIKSEAGLRVGYVEYPADNYQGIVIDKNSWLFDFVSALQITEHIPTHGLREKNAIKWVLLEDYEIQLVAQPDVIYGLMAIDYKTRWKEFAEPDDILVYYIDSIQWKTYLYVYALTQFKYVFINLEKTQQHDIISIKNITPVTLYAYPSMYNEVLEYLRDFANWIVYSGNEEHFRIKEDLVVL